MAKKGTAKLSAEKVRQIRERWANGEGSYESFATEFGVSKTAIARVLAGKTWKNAGGPIVGDRRKSYSDELVEEIRVRFAQEEVTQAELSEQLGVPVRFVSAVVRGVRRKQVGGPKTTEPRLKLTDADVADIRETYARGDKTSYDLAKQYDVSQGYMSDILRGHSYSESPGPISRHNQIRFSPEDVRKIRAEFASDQDATVTEFAERFGCSVSRMSRLINRVTYADVGEH